MNNVATLYDTKLRLTSSWLGNQRPRENVRRFRRDKDGKLAVDLSQWNWTFKQAADALHMNDVDTDTIRPQMNIVLPTLVLTNSIAVIPVINSKACINSLSYHQVENNSSIFS